MKLDQIINDISTILMRSDLSLEAQAKIMDVLRKECVSEKTCLIYGVEKAADFKCAVHEKDVVAKCHHIWTNPESYSKYRHGSEEAYYNFAKYLWVQYPDGRNERLVGVAETFQKED